jgi:hypothetical protein
MNDADYIGKKLSLSVKLKNGNVLFVDVEKASPGFLVISFCDIDGERESWVVGPVEADMVSTAVGHAVDAALQVLDCDPGEIPNYLQYISSSLENAMQREGWMEDPTRKPVVEKTLSEWMFNVDRVFQQELPDELCGYKFDSLSNWRNDQRRCYEYLVKWVSGEDALTMIVTLDDCHLRVEASLVEQRLREKIREKLKRLQEENPGDFEVECQDNTGVEEHFDAGLKYLAEQHTDKDLVWVYDRYGNKGEYGLFRFKRVEVMQVKNLKSRFKPLEPGGKIRIIGEPQNYFQHFNKGEPS